MCCESLCVKCWVVMHNINSLPNHNSLHKARQHNKKVPLSRSTRNTWNSCLPDHVEHSCTWSIWSLRAHGAAALWSIWSTCSPRAHCSTCSWTVGHFCCCDSLCVNCCVLGLRFCCVGALFVYALMKHVKPQYTSISKRVWSVNFLPFVIRRCKVAKLADHGTPNPEMSAPGNASCIIRTDISQCLVNLCSPSECTAGEFWKTKCSNTYTAFCH